jgi:hypothetical protein
MRLAARRTALPAMQAAHRPTPDRRLTARQAGALRARAATRRVRRIAAPVAVPQGFPKGQEVRVGIDHFPLSRRVGGRRLEARLMGAGQLHAGRRLGHAQTRLCGHHSDRLRDDAVERLDVTARSWRPPQSAPAARELHRDLAGRDQPVDQG